MKWCVAGGPAVGRRDVLQHGGAGAARARAAARAPPHRRHPHRQPAPRRQVAVLLIAHCGATMVTSLMSLL